MLTAEQVLNYQFSKAGMNGYRAAEVDQLLTEVTEALRGGKNEVTPEMLQRLDTDYENVVHAIQEYQQSAD